MLDVLDYIEKANEEELEQVLKATGKRYGVLFPNWEMSVISVEKNTDRNAQIDEIIKMLKEMKKTL